jgi:hypothetical protein
MDCRNPEAKDGIHAAWMPPVPGGMTEFDGFNVQIVNRF